MAEITIDRDLDFYCFTCGKEIEADQRISGKNKGVYVERCESCLEKDSNDRDRLSERIAELEEELADIRRAS